MMVVVVMLVMMVMMVMVVMVVMMVMMVMMVMVVMMYLLLSTSVSPHWGIGGLGSAGAILVYVIRFVTSVSAHTSGPSLSPPP